MKKFDQLGIRWSPDLKDRWADFAKEKFRREDASGLAREVLEEYMACFLSDADLISLGLVNRIGGRPGGLLCYAVAQADKVEAPALSKVRELMTLLESADERVQRDNPRSKRAPVVKAGRTKAS